MFPMSDDKETTVVFEFAKGQRAGRFALHMDELFDPNLLTGMIVVAGDEFEAASYVGLAVCEDDYVAAQRCVERAEWIANSYDGKVVQRSWEWIAFEAVGKKFMGDVATLVRMSSLMES